MFAWSCSSDSFWLVLFGTSLWLLWAFVFAWLAGSFVGERFGFGTGLGASGGLWLIDFKLDFVSAGLLELYERFGFFVRHSVYKSTMFGSTCSWSVSGSDLRGLDDARMYAPSVTILTGLDLILLALLNMV